MPAPPDHLGTAEDSLRAVVQAPEWHIRHGQVSLREVDVAVEVPVALQYNGISHAVMLASPGDLADFGLGFSLSEGILDRASDLYGLDVQPDCRGITLAMQIATEPFERLRHRRRTLAGRTGCGLCGTESLDQVLRPVRPIPGTGRLALESVAVAVRALPGHQVWGASSGSHHAAAWCSAEGALVVVREDVGRHNALDKLVGARARLAQESGQGFFCVTSRASVEMVQKTAMAGVPVLVAVSGPTSLACEVAHEWGVTLIGFARDSGCAVYTHPHRVTLSGRTVA